MSTYGTTVEITSEEIYNNLSIEDKKRFNKAIIVGAESDESTVKIKCVLVNDVNQ